MTEMRFLLYLFVLTGLALAALVGQQGRTIQQQRDLIRQMETNPKCMVAPTGGNRG